MYIWHTCVYVYVYVYVCVYVCVCVCVRVYLCMSICTCGHYFTQFDGRKYCEHDFNVLFAPCCNKCGLLTNALPVIPIPRNSGPLKYQPNPDTPLLSTVLPLTYTVCVFMYMCVCMCVCVCVCVCVYYNMKLIKVI